MLRRNTGIPWLWLSALLCALSGTAQAGPVEILNAASISPANPNNLVVSYTYGSHGVFVSQDGGATLKWLCSGGVDSSVFNRTFITYASGDGSIYVGSQTGLLRGDADGCNFQVLPELAKRDIRAITGDPIDPTRTYVTTSNTGADNGIYMRAGSGEFVAFGTQVAKYVASLHVVKNAEKRRFYETGAFSNLATNSVDYTVRVSDDDGMTWSEEAFDTTQFPVAEMGTPTFLIVAIDPQNPDHVVAQLSRSMKTPDTLIFSREKGKAGSWERLTGVVELGGIVFAPDGTLYFGDDNFETKGLYKVARLGEQPERVTDKFRVTCLAYDAAGERLLGCSNNYHFGTLDMQTGELTPLLDLRCAEHAVECPNQPAELREACQPPTTEYCKLDHWAVAPLCAVYDRGPDCATYTSSQGYNCKDGYAVPVPTDDAGVPQLSDTSVCMQPGTAPAAGSSGSSAAGAGSSAAAGSGVAAAGSGGAGSGAKASGCNCSSLGGASRTLPALRWLLLALAALGVRVRSRRRSWQRHGYGYSTAVSFLP